MSSYYSNYRNYLLHTSPFYRLLFVLLLVLLFFLLTSFVGLAVIMISYGLNLQEISFIMDNPDSSHVALLKLQQVILSTGMFIVPAFIASFFLGTRSTSYLKMDVMPSWPGIILVSMMMIVWIPVINFTASLNAKLNLPDSWAVLEKEIITLRDNYSELTNLFLETRSMADFFANLAMMAILPAIGEELMFRGIFQRIFSDWTRNVHWGIIITSLLFSFFHFEFYGFLPRFLLGMLFGYLFVWTASIWIPMLAHFINNGIIVGYYFFRPPGKGSSELDELGTHADLFFWLSLGGGMLLLAALFYHERSHRISGS